MGTLLKVVKIILNGKVKELISFLMFFGACLLLSGSILAQTGVGIFGGGAIYKTEFREDAIPKLKNSGMNFVVLWTIHIMENGDLDFNVEFPVVSNGVYIGDATYPEFRNDMTALVTQPTSINRLEVGVGAASSQSFHRIQAYYEGEGFGPGTTMYENWKALKDSIPEIDAINFNDESNYDTPSLTAFSIMLFDLGY